MSDLSTIQKVQTSETETKFSLAECHYISYEQHFSVFLPSVKQKELLYRSVKCLVKWKILQFTFSKGGTWKTLVKTNVDWWYWPLVAALNGLKPGIHDFKQRCNTFPARLGFATDQEWIRVCFQQIITTQLEVSLPGTNWVIPRKLQPIETIS